MVDSDNYLVEIRPRSSSRRLRDAVRKAPGVFLLHAAFRRALRSQHRLRNGLPSIVIVIVDTEEIGDSHRKAAELALTGRVEPWPHLRRQSKAYVHVLDLPSKKKPKPATAILEEHGRHELILVLARNRSEVPEELTILADDIVDLEPPTAAHINAARCLLGRSRIDELTATAIASLDFSVMVLLACKPQVSLEVVRRLVAVPRAPIADAVPRLEELPGYGSARNWALAFIEDVRRFNRGHMDWAHMDRGVLLVGPPGTGKTLFAQALAKSAGLPLITASVSQWQSYGHLGDLLGAMRRTFEAAQAQQPAIVFLDELDAIGDRTQFADHHANYSRQVVNYLLESIDGAGGRHQIVVIGATNFPQAIDAALLRSGRLERHIPVSLPDEKERFDILQFHLKLTDDITELRDIAADLEGWNGADLEMIAREARRIGRRQSRQVQVADVANSLPPVQELSEESLRRIAIHEAGHVIVAHVLSPRAKISVAIRRRVRWLGSQGRQRGGAVRYQLPEDERSFDTRDQLESLTYLRDRLTAMRDLLTESGSIFVQIGDEHVHRVRAVLDELFGETNFVSMLVFKKTGGQSSSAIANVNDYIVWYARDKTRLKSRPLYSKKVPGEEGATNYEWVEEASGLRRAMKSREKSGDEPLPHGCKIMQPYPMFSDGPSQRDRPLVWRRIEFKPSSNSHWKTHGDGLQRVAKADRFVAQGKTLRFVNYLTDYDVTPILNIWTDTQTSGFGADRLYIVQTLPKVIERCLLMATDPGDLVLDPTCGSGTTAYVAEQWGRRWITMDTSRVALALARTRLMAARYPWYLLADSRDGRVKEAALTQRPQPDTPFLGCSASQ